MWGRCLEEASYTLNDVTFCASWRFHEEVASSTNFQDSEDVGEDVISSLG